jgi:hypothetical protein
MAWGFNPFINNLDKFTTAAELHEQLTHANLKDMPDTLGTNSDHDARYYTETEVDTLLSGYLTLDQTTPQSVINGAPLFNVGLKSPKIYPSADSTTAVGIFKADGTTNVLNVDTTNGNVGIGTTSPDEKLEVNGNIYLQDNDKSLYGTGKDASIYYDATNLIINPKEVGSGEVEVKGNVDMDFNDIKDANQVEVAGYIELPEDGGICLLTDLPQNTAVLNTEQSYSFQIGGEELLKLKSLSDGAGGIKDKTVSVDAALEANSIATFSINAVCNNNEVICHNNEVMFS